METKAKAKPTKKPVAKKPVAKKTSPVVGGGMVDDIRSLAVPFALTLLTKSIKSKPAKETSKKETAAPAKKLAPAKRAGVRAAVGGAAKKPAADMSAIRAEFMSITQQIHDFLKKY